MTAEPPVIAEVWIDAPPERVFPYFTDPERLSRWLGTAVQLDPVPGGVFATDIGHHDGTRRQVRGEYLELAKPHRVVFSWGDVDWPDLPPGSTRVEIDLVAADGGTTVTLNHSGLRGQRRADHARGWPVVLGRLVAAASPTADV